MYSVLDQKLFDAYNELKCEPIIAIIEPNMYTGKFDWAKCVRPTGTRNYVKVSSGEIVSHLTWNNLSGDPPQCGLCPRRGHQDWRRVCHQVSLLSEILTLITMFRVMVRLVEAICEEVNR